ncbi:MAG: RNA polymerase sigma factor [Patescibacteria group bacterium]|jgi:RNA polymerase sigma factor (sigma-70 family)
MTVENRSLPNEANLIGELYSDDKAKAEVAFAQIHRKYFNRLVHYVNQFLRNESGQAEAEEIAQDVFEELWQKISDEQGSGRIRSISKWLIMIAKRKSINEKIRGTLVREVKESAIAEDAPLPLGTQASQSPFTIAARHEQVQLFDKAVDTIKDERLREVLRLLAAEQTNKEIAEELEIKPNHANVLVHRAKQALEARVRELEKTSR